MQKLSFGILITVSISYFSAFAITSGLILPLQKIILPDVPVLFSVLFLPHGVRVLVIWLLGWRGALYLVLPSYLTWVVAVFGSDIELTVISPAVSIFCVYSAVTFVRYFSGISMQVRSDFVNWKLCLFGGLVASLLNGFALAVVIPGNFSWFIMSGFTFGDIAGQIVLMVILIFIMRTIRMAQSPS